MRGVHKVSDITVHQCDENNLKELMLHEIDSSVHFMPVEKNINCESGEICKNKKCGSSSFPLEHAIVSVDNAVCPEGARYPDKLPVTQNGREMSVDANKCTDTSLLSNVREHEYEYVLCVVNPRSGDSDTGLHVFRTMQTLLGKERVVMLDSSLFSDPDPLREAIRCHAVRFASHKGGAKVTESVEKRGTIIVSGGDGTVSFVMEQLDAVRRAIEMVGVDAGDDTNTVVRSNGSEGGHFVLPAIAVLALGTGNDFSNCMGFGGGYSRYKGSGFFCCMDNPIEPIIHDVITTPAVPFDRWFARLVPLSVIREQRREVKRCEVRSEASPATLEETKEADHDPFVALQNIKWDALDAAGKCVKFSFINYFSVGFDAFVLQKFSNFRAKHPVFCGKRWRNKLVYGMYGLKAAFKCPPLRSLIPTICVPGSSKTMDISPLMSGETADMKKTTMTALNLPKECKCLLVTNVDSYAAGAHPWKEKRSSLYRDTPGTNPMIITPVRINDRKMEVQALGGLHHMGLLQLRISDGAQKLAQAREMVAFFFCTPKDILRSDEQQNEREEANNVDSEVQASLCIQADGEPGPMITEPTVLYISELQQPRVFVRCRNPKVVWTSSLSGEDG